LLQNQYESGEFGKQDADKGVRFLSFPPVLHLHLKRFEYDWHTDRSYKVNDELRFDVEMNLDAFLDENVGPAARRGG
jgi:ubiquitin carboxyl-terminal hydrolase 7